MSADHALMLEDQTTYKVWLRQRQVRGVPLWCGFSLLVGQGFYTQQETAWHPTAEKAAAELKRGVPIFHRDFHSDLFEMIDDALAAAKTAELMEKP